MHRRKINLIFLINLVLAFLILLLNYLKGPSILITEIPQKLKIWKTMQYWTWLLYAIAAGYFFYDYLCYKKCKIIEIFIIIFVVINIIAFFIIYRQFLY
ncbi:hypothetical protein SAMN05660826_02332 [Caldanaerovirga acetigignens]|uniref:Uncharacterized protein n=1 Tax=Caldanaerovirga acetigignens TaxID=447595 RepID=A0A1M7ML81_9FIRM|nr:hypothetical protein SAMN05660826_02332 [Caldanaerovirga acetigignens]